MTTTEQAPEWLAAALAGVSPIEESPYVEDPIAWVGNRLGEFLWSKQREIAESVRDNKRTAVPSCHDAGKSFIASRLIAWWIDSHPPGTAFVVSTAPSFAQVRMILWREIGKAHRRGGLPGRVNQTEWHLGPEPVGYGRKPDDYDEDSFQGIHARYVLVVIDEACGVPADLWTGVEAITTNADCRILAIGNPTDPATEFGAVCKPGSGWNVIPISAVDTPNFTGEVVPPQLRPMLLDPEWVEDKKIRWGVDSPVYQARVLGEFPELGNDTLISAKHVREAQERTRETGGHPIVEGVDVARFGSDETIIGTACNGQFRILEARHKQSTMETAGRVIVSYREVKPTPTQIRVDGVGVGGGVVDRLAEQGFPVLDMQAGAQAMDPALFKNARAEWYWGLRQLFEDGLVDIDPDDDELAAQLQAIKYMYTSRGQLQIESKDDMRKRGMPSPDRADTMMLAMAKVNLPPAGQQYTSDDVLADFEDVTPLSAY